MTKHLRSENLLRGLRPSWNSRKTWTFDHAFLLSRNQTDRGSGRSSDSLTRNSGFCCLWFIKVTQDSSDLRTLGPRGCARATLVGGLQACSGSCGQKARVRDPPGTVAPAPPRACGARWRLRTVRVGVSERSHAARPTPPLWRLPPGWAPACAGRVAGPACPRRATLRASGSGRACWEPLGEPSPLPPPPPPPPPPAGRVSEARRWNSRPRC